MANNVLPDPLNVNIASPDPLNTAILSPLSQSGEAVLVEQTDKIRAGIVTLMYDGLLTSSTLAAPATSQDRTLTLVDATGFNVGDSITSLSLASDRVFPIIISVAGNTIELDRLIDGSYPIGTPIENTPIQLNVAGSAVSPVIYKVAPPPGEIWHLTRGLISMTHSAGGDMGKFGGISALTYGVQGRILKSGEYTTFINWKTNSDMALSMYDVKFDDRSGGGGDHGTTGRFTFANTGTVIELFGDTGDQLQMLIQDNLTGLDSFKIAIQGHVK